MLTREQAYAADVFQRVSDFKKKSPEKVSKYGAMSHQLPVLIRTAGLVQALNFVNGRKDETLDQLLNDLAQTIAQTDSALLTIGEPDGKTLNSKDKPNDKPTPPKDNLVAASRTATLSHYMRLTQQTMAALLWYKRFAQSVLEVDSTEG